MATSKKLQQKMLLRKNRQLLQKPLHPSSKPRNQSPCQA